MSASHTSAAILGQAIPVLRPGFPGMSYHKITPVVCVRDVNYSGTGRVSGTTKVKGTPDYAVRRMVRLFREKDGTKVREQWSNATTGAYSFDYIDINEKYTVVSYDYQHNFRAVIADNITPDPMP